MHEIFTTERFYLREKHIDDAEDMYLLNADPEVLRFTGDIAFKNIEEAKIFISNYDHFKRHGFGRWVIIDKTTDNYVGWCGLKKHADGMIDLGYRIKREYWGQGIASECAQACLDYGFKHLKLNQIVGRSVKENIASVKILEKIGMQFWKKDTCDGLPNAVWYQIDKETYLKQ